MSRILRRSSSLLHRNLSVRYACKVSSGKDLSCKVLVLGVTTGGLAVANRLAQRLSTEELVILGPEKYHYYKEHMCLVGVGVKSLDSLRAETRTLLPESITWVPADIKSIQASSSSIQVTTSEDRTIKSEYLVVALDLVSALSAVSGLEDALADPKSGVCAAYYPKYAQKTWDTLRSFKGGTAIFATCSRYDSPSPYFPWVDCMPYLADSYFKKSGVRGKTKMMFFNQWPLISGIKEYNNALEEIMKAKNIHYSSSDGLRNFYPNSKTVLFNEQNTYDLFHISYYGYPPPSTTFLEMEKWVEYDVDIETLQAKKYPRIYALGENLMVGYKSTFTTGIESEVVAHNLLSTMDNKPQTAKFNGYRLVPYMTSDDKCMLGEWTGTDMYGKDFKIHQTFRCNQAIPSRFAHYVNQYIIPHVYWNCIIKGKYNGQEWLRKLLHPFDH